MRAAARIAAFVSAELRILVMPAMVALIASECGVVPADVVFVRPGSLPRTSSGKLRRLEVKRNLEGAGQ